MKQSLFVVIAILSAVAGVIFFVSCGGGGSGGSDDPVANLVIQGPSTVDEGSQASYSASVLFTDGTVLDVTDDASWSVITSNYATISIDGTLTPQPITEDVLVLLSASYTDGSLTMEDSILVLINNLDYAVVVETLDGEGNPVNGVELVLDWGETLTTGSQLNEGQVYKDLSLGGDHTLQLDADSLSDSQGGQGWVPLASRISGELESLSFGSRPFAGGSDALVFPTSPGAITVVTIHLADILVSPTDNQWLTDGLDAGNAYRTADTDEFAGSPRPVFWWRQDSSMGETVNFTFQMWEDDDDDTRYPMGVMNEADYSAFSKTPAWEESSQAMFTTVMYSSGGTDWPLGWTYAYAGSPLGTSPPEGEYAWRVIQENPDRGIIRISKLGAFYTYSGYYYASTEAGSLAMAAPSAKANHRDVFNFVEAAISSADVIGAPFDSTDSTGYRQRTAAQFATDLAAGSSSTNQLKILYNTDEDGAVVVAQETGGGYLGILKVRTTNKSRPHPTPEPWLQGKEFLLSYFSTDDELVTFPPPLFGGGIFYIGILDDPDWVEPER